MAEHAPELAEWFVTPGVDVDLPGQVASKQGLHELCSKFGVPSPAASFPTTIAEVDSFAATATFPVIAKNLAPFERLRSPTVSGTRLVSSAEDLRGLAAGWPPHFAVIAAGVPARGDVAEDWIFQGYFDAASESLVAFTGVKLRSWPPQPGRTTSRSRSRNAALARLSTDLCRTSATAGIVDLDWRLDRRDGRYKLLDFNPRVGAQFRLFETDAGIDVVRAMHLDLTGRAVPRGVQIEGRGFVQEHLDRPAGSPIDTSAAAARVAACRPGHGSWRSGPATTRSRSSRWPPGSRGPPWPAWGGSVFAGGTG